MFPLINLMIRLEKSDNNIGIDGSDYELETKLLLSKFYSNTKQIRLLNRFLTEFFNNYISYTNEYDQDYPEQFLYRVFTIKKHFMNYFDKDDILFMGSNLFKENDDNFESAYKKLEKFIRDYTDNPDKSKLSRLILERISYLKNLDAGEPKEISNSYGIEGLLVYEEINVMRSGGRIYF